MRLLSIEISGFRSYGEKVVFRFPEANGLFLVRGENGVGKSGLADALSWVMFGYTVRGLTSGDVESWVSDLAPCVVLRVEVGGVERVVRRTRKPIEIRLDGELVQQAQLDELFQPYERALHTMFIGQFGRLFPDMRPAERLTLISAVLELDEWIEIAKHASKELSELERKRDEWSEKLATRRERRQTLKETLEKLSESSASWEKGRGIMLDDAKERLENAKGALDSARDAVAEANAQVLRAEEEYETAEKWLSDLQLEKNKMREERASLSGRAQALDDEVAELHARFRELKEAANTTCPSCEQTITEEHARSCRDVVRKKANEKVDELDRLGVRLAELDEELIDQQGRIDAAGSEERQLLRALNDAKSAKNVASNKLQSVLRTIEDVTAEVEGHEDAENPHAVMQEKVEKEATEIERKIEEARIWTYDLQTELDLKSVWTSKGFKELRLWRIDNALQELTICANSSLVELGLHGWALEFTVERETQKGTVSRGFEVTVRSPYSPDRVPWESWSGGQTQRLRIACAVGLANLIRSRMPDPPEFEWWDEPTTFLNVEGVKDLVDFFRARAMNTQVWLIDHRSVDAGAFDKTYTVTMEDGNSRIDPA